MKLLYATSNPGKLIEVGRHLAGQGVEVLSPADLGLELDVEETGQTLEDNAALKVEAYRARAPEVIVMSDDTGVEIDALGGEPGIHVRRWQDQSTAMSDQAIIDHCIERMRGVPPDRRGAQFRTVIAIARPDGPVEHFDGVLRGSIVETPGPLQFEGFPFEALFHVDEWDKLLGDVHALSAEEKRRSRYLTHRERAVQKALPRLRELLA